MTDELFKTILTPKNLTSYRQIRYFVVHHPFHECLTSFYAVQKSAGIKLKGVKGTKFNLFGIYIYTP